MSGMPLKGSNGEVWLEMDLSNYNSEKKSDFRNHDTDQLRTLNYNFHYFGINNKCTYIVKRHVLSSSSLISIQMVSVGAIGIKGAASGFKISLNNVKSLLKATM
jgi:hypothetical protein